MIRIVSIAVAVLLSLVAHRAAEAGCLSSCDMAVMPAISGPGCLAMTFDDNDCVCRTTLTITNNCSEPLEAVGFEWCQYDYSSDCPTTIAPGATGYLFTPRPAADTLGEHQVTLDTRLGSAAQPLTLSYEVVHLDKRGCSVAAGDTALPAVFAIGLVLVRRRRPASRSLLR